MLIQINWLRVCHTEKEKNNKSLDIIIYVMYTRVYVTPRVVGEMQIWELDMERMKDIFSYGLPSSLAREQTKRLTSWSSEL